MQKCLIPNACFALCQLAVCDAAGLCECTATVSSCVSAREPCAEKAAAVVTRAVGSARSRMTDDGRAAWDF